MKEYVVAASEREYRRNNCQEVMASSFAEARDRAELFGVPCTRTGPHGEGTYFITDGERSEVMECEFIVPAEIEGVEEESPELFA